MDLLLPHVQCVTVSNIVHVSRIIRAVVSVVGEYAAALQRPATGVTALMCPSPATQSGQWFFSSAVTVTLHQHRHLHQPLARATASSSRRLIGEELQIPGELIPEESCCLLDVFRERGALGGAEEGSWISVTRSFCGRVLEAIYVCYSGCRDLIRVSCQKNAEPTVLRQVWHRFDSSCVCWSQSATGSLQGDLLSATY